MAHIYIVTTCEDMQDPLPPELAAVYSSAGAAFAYVGPLLDCHGAKRAAGHKFAQATGPAESAESREEAMQQLTQARNWVAVKELKLSYHNGYI